MGMRLASTLTRSKITREQFPSVEESVAESKRTMASTWKEQGKITAPLIDNATRPYLDR